MPVYKFECGCGERRQEYMTFEEHDIRTKHVEGSILLLDTNEHFFRQVFNFMYMRPMPEHYSPFIDGHVKSRRDYDDQVKIKEAEMSERMGYDVHYAELDPSDAKAAQVTDEGLEETERAWHNDTVMTAEDHALFDA